MFLGEERESNHQVFVYSSIHLDTLVIHFSGVDIVTNLKMLLQLLTNKKQITLHSH